MDWRGVWTGTPDADFDAYCQVVEPGASDAALGAALRAALKASRINIPVPAAWARGVGSDKAEFDQTLAEAFGLSNARRLYPGMRCCAVEWEPNTITVYPTRRRHGGEFEAFQSPWRQDHPDVVLPFRASDAVLGAAARTGLERCL
ncbi:MAG: contact-dependent growth inhibition system immunity protein [Caulobacter sp.]|nr:contact-dependent growth inhibition system immunity protein [Caulobacter sp.]